MNNNTQEARKVLTIPTSKVEGLIGKFSGFCPKDLVADPHEEFYKIWNTMFENECSFSDKEKAEKDLSLKQVIPYFILINKGDVMAYSRGTESEERLHGTMSIGVGGHIESYDGLVSSEAYFTGAQRELIEEASLMVQFGDINNAFVGFINDESTEVSQVHLGLAHIIVINDNERDALEKKGCALGKVDFIPIDEIQNEIENFEKWSQHAIKMISRTEEASKEKQAFLTELTRIASTIIYPASCRLASKSMPINHVLDMEIRSQIKDLGKLVEYAKKEKVL